MIHVRGHIKVCDLLDIILSQCNFKATICHVQDDEIYFEAQGQDLIRLCGRLNVDYAEESDGHFYIIPRTR